MVQLSGCWTHCCGPSVSHILTYNALDYIECFFSHLFLVVPYNPTEFISQAQKTWTWTSITALLHFHQYTNERRLVENKGCKCAPFQHRAPPFKNSMEFKNSVVF